MTKSSKSAKPGRRSHYDAKPWECPKCATVYPPIKCSLIDLPQLECPNCHIKNETRFNFSIVKLHRNKINLCTQVYDQGSSRFCVVYACKAQAELKFRVKGAEKGWFVDRKLDEQDMIAKYEEGLGGRYGQEVEREKGRARVDRMYSVLKKGVKFKKYGGLFKIREIHEIPKDDFPQICKSLANGEPLVASFPTGQDFAALRPNKVYKSPRIERIVEDGKKKIAHSVCLIGAGACGEGELYQRYFWFRNSHGETFGLRGDGMLLSTDIIRNPFAISI